MRNPALRPLCGSTAASTQYDANGNVTKRVEHDGTVNFFTYDAKGRETEKATFPASYAGNATRPALNLATSVTSTQWHATWNLPTKIAEPNKITAFTYANANATTGMGAGNLTGRSETQTTDATGAAKFTATQAANTAIKSTGWSYSSTNLPTTIVERETAFGSTTATQTGKWTYAFNAVGDITSVKDAAGAVLSSAISYDAHGNIVGETDKLGYVNRTYLPRGQLKRQMTESEVLDFSYDARSKLLAINSSNGGKYEFSYSTLGQLTQLKLNGVVVSTNDYEPSSATTTTQLIKSGISGNQLSNGFSASSSVAIPVPGGRVGPAPGARVGGGRAALIGLTGQALIDYLKKCLCKEGYVDIYRLTGPNEYAAIQSSNVYSINPAPGGFGEKQFWFGLPQAQLFAVRELALWPERAKIQRYIVTSKLCKKNIIRGAQLNEPGIGPYVSFGPDALIEVNFDADATGGIRTVEVIPAKPN